MNIFESIVLGILQGLTEFIPVSSSGHEYLLPRLLNFAEPSTSYILFIHLGTLLSLIYYYRRRLYRYLKVSLRAITRRSKLDSKDTSDLKLIRNVTIATIPAAILGIALENVISNFYDNNNFNLILGLAVIIPMIVIGILFLFEKELFKNNDVNSENLGVTGSLAIGLFQALAFVRGVSRSGITLLAGQAVGLKRVSAAEFSFLMSIPIIAATSLYGVYKTLKLPQEALNQELGIAVVGMLAAFISGSFAIQFLLNYLKKKDLKVFGYYRIIFGIVALGILLIS